MSSSLSVRCIPQLNRNGRSQSTCLMATIQHRAVIFRKAWPPWSFQYLDFREMPCENAALLLYVLEMPDAWQQGETPHAFEVHLLHPASQQDARNHHQMSETHHSRLESCHLIGLSTEDEYHQCDQFPLSSNPHRMQPSIPQHQPEQEPVLYQDALLPQNQRAQRSRLNRITNHQIRCPPFPIQDSKQSEISLLRVLQN